MARSRGAGVASRAATTSSVPNVPSGPQGNMLAWCSTTVVTTTSSAESRKR